jgi:hypothetical protein
MYCRAGHHQRYNWMVFNDFHITPSMPEEVAELYGGQKLPCLLYYTQVREGGKGAVVLCCSESEVSCCYRWLGLAAGSKASAVLVSDCAPPFLITPTPQVEAVQRAAECAPVPPRPVLTQEGFLSLCRMPPLQVRACMRCPARSTPASCAAPLLLMSLLCLCLITSHALPAHLLPLPHPRLQGPKVRLHKPTFAPLLPNELPQPGTLFALDAEFVAYSPPEKALQRQVAGQGCWLHVVARCKHARLLQSLPLLRAADCYCWAAHLTSLQALPCFLLHVRLQGVRGGGAPLTPGPGAGERAARAGPRQGCRLHRRLHTLRGAGARLPHKV